MAPGRAFLIISIEFSGEQPLWINAIAINRGALKENKSMTKYFII
jgi:hypothetical protein